MTFFVSFCGILHLGLVYMNDKFIFLVRHGEAKEFLNKADDFYRKLNFVGKKRICVLYEHLLHLNIIPEQIFSSCATRAVETMELLAGNFTIDSSQLKYIEDLYQGHLENYSNAVKTTNCSIQKLMIVGHNPAISDFATYLVGKSIEWLHPGGIIGIKLGGLTSWKSLYGIRSLNELLFVKNFLYDKVNE